jgi:cob(I)alamin adenosyltransferase
MGHRGLVHIYTGDGKGKTTASLGLAMRAAGMGFKVLIVQFFKEDKAPSGEKEFLRGIDSGIELIRANCRHPIFTGDKTDRAKVAASIADTFELAKEKVAEGGLGLIVFDEILAAVNGGWLASVELLKFIEGRPKGLEVVMTGRAAPVELVKAADYVTEMLNIKHPYDEGVAARKGIDF